MTECTDPGFPASEPLENQGLQEPKIILTKSPRELRFEQVNEVTVKLTDCKGLSFLPATDIGRVTRQPEPSLG